MAGKIVIPVPNARGEDGYRISSVRLKKEMWDRLDAIAKENKLSRNEVVRIMLEYCIDNVTLQKED